MLEESDTYLMILEKGEQRAAGRDILLVGEERLGTADEPVRGQFASITDAERLVRMLRRAATAATWQEILDTPSRRSVSHARSSGRFQQFAAASQPVEWHAAAAQPNRLLARVARSRRG